MVRTILPMKGTTLSRESSIPSATLTTLFAPDGATLYARVLVPLFQGVLPDLHTLIEAQQSGTQGSLPVEEWTSSFLVQDESHPFGTGEYMSLELRWYRDQNACQGLNFQAFCTGLLDFPPLAWVSTQAGRHGIALLRQANPEMVDHYCQALPRSAPTRER